MQVMHQGEHSAILLTFIKLPLIFVLSIFERPFYTGFTVCHKETVQGFFLQFWEGALGPFRLEKLAR